MSGPLNEYSPLGETLDPGRRRFIYHGFILQLLLAHILPANDTAIRLVELLGGIVVLYTLLTAGLIRLVLARTCPFTHGLALATGLTVAAIGTVASANAARPEVFAGVVVTLACLATLRVGQNSSRIAILFHGVAVGVIGLTSPLSGVMAAFLAVMYQAWANGSIWRTIISSAVVGGIAVATAGALFTFFPFPVPDWVTAVRAHGRIAPYGTISPGGMVYGLVANPILPGFGGFVAVGFAVGCRTVLRWRGAIGSPWLFATAFFGLSVLLLATSLGIGAKHYNFLPVIPPMIAVGFATLADRPRWLLALGGAAGVVSMGLVRSALVCVAFQSDGVSLREARAAFAAIGLSPEVSVGCDGSAFYLIDDYHAARGIRRDWPNYPTNGLNLDYLVIGQQASGWITPPSFEGYDLIANHFVEHPPRVLGIRIGNTMPGYGFAVYKRMSRQ